MTLVRAKTDSGAPKSLRGQVIGLGGAGGRIVEYLVGSGIRDADFTVIDSFFWEGSDKPGIVRIVIGEKVERRTFSSITPEWARKAVQEDRRVISDALHGAEFAIVLAGLGGGFGSSATTEIVRVVKESGVMAIAIVSEPFGFEGKTRHNRSLSTLPLLSTIADLVVKIPHNRLRKMLNPKQTLREAFETSNMVFTRAVRGIQTLFNGSAARVLAGQAADIRNSLCSGATAYFGFSEADAPLDALTQALSCPLMGENNWEACRALLISVDLPRRALGELEWAVKSLKDRFQPGNEIILAVSEAADRSMVAAQVFRVL